MTDLRYLLAIYVHAHQTGNSVPPHIDAEARAALAAKLPTPTLAKLMSPQPGYQPGDGKEDGAQLVEGDWWAPEFGCDSLDRTLEAIRYRIAPYLREPVAGVDVPGPDGDWGCMVELCRAQGVEPELGVPLLQRARKAWDVGDVGDPPAPALDPSDFQTLQGIALDMVESLRPIVIPEILCVLRKAIEQPPAPVPAAEGPAVPDEVREAFAELERREQNLRVFRNVRAAMDAELPAPAPAAEEEGEREKLAQWLESTGSQQNEVNVRSGRLIINHYYRAAELLREPATAPKRVVLWEEVPINVLGLRRSLTTLAGEAYRDGCRDTWAFARREVERQQGQQDGGQVDG